MLSNNLRTFQVVGTTTFKGATKVWFGNETATKVKNMEKQGHTNIEFITLPKPMNKAAVLKFLAANPGLLAVEQDLASELILQKTQKLNALKKRAAVKSAPAAEPAAEPTSAE